MVRVVSVPPSATCVNGFISSNSYFSGMLTLLYSLMRHDRDITCVNAFVWHPRLQDSVLSESQRLMISRVSGTSPVKFIRADDSRAEAYLRLMPLGNTSSSFLRFEFFFMNFTGTFMYLDTDMLVLKSTSFVHKYLDESAGITASWEVHAAAQNPQEDGLMQATYKPPVSKERKLNNGFFAFRVPPSVGFRNAVVSKLKAQRTPKDDQSLLNDLFRAYKAEGFVLTLHYDWYTNYRPLNVEDIPKWRIPHWYGVDKPWGAYGFTANGNKSALPELNALWKQECIALNRNLGESSAIACGNTPDTNSPSGRVRGPESNPSALTETDVPEMDHLALAETDEDPDGAGDTGLDPIDWEPIWAFLEDRVEKLDGVSESQIQWDAAHRAVQKKSKS